MSVQSQIDRIEQNVENTYDVLEEAGAVMPETRNSNNLAETAASICAVLYGKEQSLTKEQKAQVQRNIGVVGAITPQDYGAKGDNSTDDTQAFQTALANNRIVYVPGGSYKLSGELIIENNCQIELAQDAVLYFTQTTGNCISLKMCSWVKGNHATVSVPYAFAGNVINIDTGYTDDLYDTPPFTHWDPVWKPGRYITDLNIVKPNAYGLNYSDNGECSGTAIFINTDGNDTSTFLWGVDLSGLRIAGAFTYGVYGITSNFNGGDGWNHDMRVGGLIAGCETGVYLKQVHKVYLSTLVQPQKARTGVAYAKNGIYLDNCKYINLLNGRTFDWNSEFTLWQDGNEHQHLALIGNCPGLVLEDWNYYAFTGYDVRDLIYTDTPSNLEKMVILQEPFTRWFKPKDGVPYFNDGDLEKPLLLKEQFDSCFLVDFIPNVEDVLPKAINTDGTIFNGIGYVKSGKTLSLTTGEFADSEYYGCTGLIRINKGNALYTKALSFSGSGNEGGVIYDASFNRITSFTSQTVSGMSYYFTYAETDEGFALTVNAPTSVAYIALTFKSDKIGNNPAISINEPMSVTPIGFLADGVEVKSENIYGLDTALEAVLADAKASGDFKGDKGDTGASGTSVTVKSVSESTADGGSNVVTFSNGKTVTIKNGSKGSTGSAGKTPVRGTDYWTAADKTEIINSVIASLPVYSGEVV